MNCPICQHPLASLRGSQLDQNKPEERRDGYTVYCPSRKCPAQEISGHGSTIKEAEKIVGQRKFKSE
jgi:hypothetical protein